MKGRFLGFARLSFVLTLGVVIAFLAGCGSDNPPPVTTSTTSGTLSVTNGTSPPVTTTVASPAGSTLALKPSTILSDVNGLPVMGNISTSVTFSTSAANIQPSAVTPVVPDVAVFLDIDMGAVKTISPPLSVSMAVPGEAAGTLVDIYSFDGTNWNLEKADVPVAADGTVSVDIPHLTVWATARKNTLRISGTPKTSVVVGTLYSFVPNVVASKPNSLTFSIANQPPWASFDTKTGALTGTPSAANVGTTSGVVITVTDGTLTRSLSAFNLTVNDVVGPPPTITTVSPTSMNEGTTGTLTIAGTNLTGAKVAVSGTGVSLGTASVSATQIVVPVTIQYGVTTGIRTITVTTPGGSAATSFTINPVRRAPTITTVAPSSMNQGASGTVTLAGTNLTSATVAISGNGVTFGPATVTSTQITVPTTVSATAAPGARTITVTTSRGSAAVTFTVNAVTPAPTVTAISPTSMMQGSAGQTLTITGTNLTGAALAITGSGVSFGAAAVTDTQITVPVTVASAAAAGARTVTVTTAGGSATAVFTVTTAATPAPAITGISPASMAQGTSGALTITGTNLTGASLSITGTGGVTFGAATITSTSITVTATVNPLATASSRTITVTTPGGTATTTFAVTAVSGATGGSGGTVF